MQVHRAGSRIRHSALLEGQLWLWRRADPLWNRVMETWTRRNGIASVVNGDSLQLSYQYGSRYEKSGYEPSVHRHFVSTIEPGMRVLDLGAHVGLFTLAAALRVGTNGRVFAFEPAPETARILRRHVRMNRWEGRVEVLEAVVSDRVGTTSFFVNGVTMSAALVKESVDVLSPERYEKPTVEIRVPTITLDAFCRERRIRPDRVKIDVEGAELCVLMGASDLLRGPVEVVCEIHPAQLELQGHSVVALESFVREVGRRLEPLHEPNELGIFHALLPRT